MSRTTTISRFVFYMNSFFLIVIVFSFQFIEWGSAASVVATLSMIPIVLTFVLVFIVTRKQIDVFDS
ncbi:MAG: hypothetical protein ABEH88_05955 [Halobacteriales archaeon]